MTLIKIKLDERKELIAKKKIERDTIRKKDVIDYLTKPLSENEIRNYNLALTLTSEGWLGGNFTEKDIKLQHLNINVDLFKNDEYEYYCQYILKTSKQKLLH